MSKSDLLNSFNNKEIIDIYLTSKIINSKIKAINSKESEEPEEPENPEELISFNFKFKKDIDLKNIQISKDFYNELLYDKKNLLSTKYENQLNINNYIFNPVDITMFYKKDIKILEFDTISNSKDKDFGIIRIDKEWFDMFSVFDDFIDNHKIIDNILTFPSFSPISEIIFDWTFFTKPKDIKYVYLGQDPYCNVDESVGVAFAINTTLPYIPKPLYNLYNKLCYQVPKIKEIPIEQWIKNGNFLQYTKHNLFLNLGLTVSKSPEYQSHIKYWKNSFTEPLLLELYNLNPDLKVICLGKESKKCIEKINKKLNNDQINNQIYDQHPASRSFTNNYLQEPIIFTEESININ